jgi:hypothetical protein
VVDQIRHLLVCHLSADLFSKSRGVKFFSAPNSAFQTFAVIRHFYRPSPRSAAPEACRRQGRALHSIIHIPRTLLRHAPHIDIIASAAGAERT